MFGSKEDHISLLCHKLSAVSQVKKQCLKLHNYLEFYGIHNLHKSPTSKSNSCVLVSIRWVHSEPLATLMKTLFELFKNLSYCRLHKPVRCETQVK